MACPFKAADAPEHVPSGYQVTEIGLFRGGDSPNQRLTTVPVCVQALTRDLNAADWSILLAWADCDGNEKSAILGYNALHRKRGEALEELAGDGMFIIPGKTTDVACFIALSAALPSMPRIVIHRRLGFLTLQREGEPDRLAFMLPNACLFPTAPAVVDASEPLPALDEEMRFHPLVQCSSYALYGSLGTLEQWRSGVMPLAQNDLVVFAVSTAFAAPFLELANVDNFIVHIFGNSSTGKTAALQGAASVWTAAGDPAKSGTKDTGIVRWSTTANAFEPTAASHSGIFLAIDEIGASGEIATSVYNITGGMGKARMSETGGLREQHRWSLCILSTGESSMQDKVETSAKRKIFTGELIRALDIPAAELAQNGDLTQEESAGLIDSFKEHCAGCNGIAGPAFIQAVLDEFQTKIALCEWLEDSISHLHAELVREANERGDKLGKPHLRALKRFAFIGAVGTLACQLGVSPFTEDNVLRAMSAAFQAWMQALPPLSEGERAIEAIRNYVVRNRSRILNYEIWAELDYPQTHLPQDMRAILKRGLLLFTPEQFEQACGGVAVKEALRQLRIQEILRREKDKSTYRVSITELDLKNFAFHALDIKRLLSGSDLSLVQNEVVEVEPNEDDNLPEFQAQPRRPSRTASMVPHPMGPWPGRAKNGTEEVPRF